MDDTDSERNTLPSRYETFNELQHRRRHSSSGRDTISTRNFNHEGGG